MGSGEPSRPHDDSFDIVPNVAFGGRFDLTPGKALPGASCFEWGWVPSVWLATTPQPRSPIPMFTIPLALHIANAAARFSGRNGAVTRQARDHGCSRQTVYNHASEVAEAIRVEHSGAPPRERLLRENEELRRENGQLWDWLGRTIDFP